MRFTGANGSIVAAVLACSVMAIGCGGGRTPQAAAATGSSSATAGAVPAAPGAGQSGDGAVITGFAFVDSSVTGQGSKAQLPPGATIYPSGQAITGTTGCPTDPYGTTGLIVAVIDYRGRPTAASLTITQPDAGPFGRPPYYLDLNPGRTLQFLGPMRGNGTWNLELQYFLGKAEQHVAKATLMLDRTCGQ
jgi:hypothetical protein